MIVNDAMVLIHLTKMSIIEKSCEHWDVVIPELIHKEVTHPAHPEGKIIDSLIAGKKLQVKTVKNKELIKKANEFNIQRGEAEAVTLYWEAHADFIATDDDNVRKKSTILNLNIIGTPAIMLTLYRKKVIDKEKMTNAIKVLKECGWFSSTVFDKLHGEIKNG
ncbi:MAG TPA: hypothetical protein VJB66_01525 [Candidatus Nanoarchaeia archaeon]|nr:hypothetical protein [Candidatus Nanoarchaeia archaeon]